MTSLIISASAPAISAPVAPAPTIDEVQRALVDQRRVASASSKTSRSRERSRCGVVERVERERVSRRRVCRRSSGDPGRQHQVVAGEPLCRPSVVTAGVAGSTSSDLGQLHVDVGVAAELLRGCPNAMSDGASWAVATW